MNIGVGDNSVEYWTEVLKSAHVNTVEGLLNLARMIAECPPEIREECGHGAGYKSASISKLCTIHLKGYDRFHIVKNMLPISWGTLYQLTALTDEEWDAAVSGGHINPNLTRGEARQLSTYKADEEDPPIVDGHYETIVIDPPWPMKIIDRDVAPLQDLSYPTLSIDEIASLNIDNCAADSAHLFCWATHKFLPDTLSIIAGWGFKYVLTMVWHKQGGFQPFGLPQYNCEFCVYARKGSPKFIDTKDFLVCFKAKRREHSRKPNEFYDVLRRVTAGPRIDIFSREEKEGFDSVGNETDAFVTGTVAQ